MPLWVRSLAFASLFLPSGALAFGDCTDPIYVDGFAGDFATAACEERETFRLRHGLGTSNVRVVSLTSDGHGEDDAWIARVERNLEDIGAALRSMGAVGTDDITILLASTVAEEGWEAEAVELADSGGYYINECGITVYKVPAGYNERQFDFVLAHEIFHCAQDKSFPESRTGDEWWVEGSAEHFAHMVVPDAGDFGWYQGFDSESATKALHELEYENVVLFHWLHQQVGAEGLAGILRSIPGGDGAAALRSVLDTARLAAFTEAFLRGEIQSPGGAAVPAADYFSGDFIVDSDADLDVAVEPLTVQRYRVRFEGERHFIVTPTGLDGAEVRMQDEAGAFAFLPQQVSSCPDPVTRLAYAVSADAPASGAIQFEQEGNEGAGACCLEGEWTPTPETLAGLAGFGNEIGGPAVAMAGGDMSCEYEGGDALLTFGPDGSGALRFDSHTTACVVRMQGQSMQMSSARSGSFDFDWTAADETKGKATYTGNSVGWAITINIGAVAQTMSEADSGPSTDTNGFAFTCTPTTLDIQGIYGLSHKENRFTRPDPAAAP
jgi:hypothetical protein